MTECKCVKTGVGGMVRMQEVEVKNVQELLKENWGIKTTLCILSDGKKCTLLLGIKTNVYPSSFE